MNHANKAHYHRGKTVKKSNITHKNQLFMILISALAVIRITDDLVSGLDGPFNIYKNIKAFVDKIDTLPNWIRSGLGCRHCISFNLGIIFSLSVPARNKRERIMLALGLGGIYNIYFRYTYGWPRSTK